MKKSERKEAERKIKKVARAAKKIKKKHRALAATICVVLVAALVVGCFFYDRSTHKISDWLDALFDPAFAGKLVPLTPAEGEMFLHFVDVGQGDSIILQFPDGKNMIIDGGDKSAKEPLLEYINQRKITDFEYLMLTHSDSDHSGSLDDVIKNTNVKHMYVPGVSNDVIKTNVYGDFLAAAEAELEEVEDSDITISASGQSFGNAEAGYQFYIIVPDEKEHNSVKKEAMSINAISPIMFLKFGDKTVCFTGDSNELNEPKFIENIKKIDWTGDGKVNDEDMKFYDCDILKVAHHGSRTSSSQDFLDVVKPEYAVIQAGAGNTYGHPTSEALSRLENTFVTDGSQGAQIFCTIDYGDVVFTLKSDEGRTEIIGPATSKTPVGETAPQSLFGPIPGRAEGTERKLAGARALLCPSDFCAVAA